MAAIDLQRLVKSDQCAIVWSAKEGWELLPPRRVPGDADKMMPDEVLALTGAFVRLSQDPEFRRDCVEWFRQQAKS